MRSLFPGHYPPSPQFFKTLWSKATFVFDTNVLLDFYSYPEEARDSFFSILEKLESRVWIPYQVAFEFHKNRLERIKSSNRELQELQKKLSSLGNTLEGDFKRISFERRNTGITDIDKRLADTKQSIKGLQEAIDKACDNLHKIGLDDPIAAKISSIFTDEKVGKRPGIQRELNELFEGGEQRYAREIAPGYKDEKQNNYILGPNLEMPAKFGDLVIWRQMLAHVASLPEKEVIFVTSEKKVDWWWVESPGKVLGPHPSLLAEFAEIYGKEKFWLYPTDRFVKHASAELEGFKVSPNAIQQIRDVSDQQFEEDILESQKLAFLRDNRERVFGDPDLSSKLENLVYMGSAIWEWVRKEHDDALIIDCYERAIVVQNKPPIVHLAYFVIDLRDYSLLIAETHSLDLFKDLKRTPSFPSTDNILIALIDHQNVSTSTSKVLRSFQYFRSTQRFLSKYSMKEIVFLVIQNNVCVEVLRQFIQFE